MFCPKPFCFKLTSTSMKKQVHTNIFCNFILIFAKSYSKVHAHSKSSNLWKFAYGNLKLQLWFLGVEVVVVDGVLGILRGDSICSLENGCRQWYLPTNSNRCGLQCHADFPTYLCYFEDANCVYKDKNILFSIKLDISICVPQFYHIIIII